MAHMRNQSLLSSECTDAGPCSRAESARQGRVQPPGSCGLFDRLPPEIRNMIYRMCLEDAQYQVNGFRCYAFGFVHPLLRTNRQLYRELAPMFFFNIIYHTTIDIDSQSLCESPTIPLESGFDFLTGEAERSAVRGIVISLENALTASYAAMLRIAIPFVKYSCLQDTIVTTHDAALGPLRTGNFGTLLTHDQPQCSARFLSFTTAPGSDSDELTQALERVVVGYTAVVVKDILQTHILQGMNVNLPVGQCTNRCMQCGLDELQMLYLPRIGKQMHRIMLQHDYYLIRCYKKLCARK